MLQRPNTTGRPSLAPECLSRRITMSRLRVWTCGYGPPRERVRDRRRAMTSNVYTRTAVKGAIEPGEVVRQAPPERHSLGGAA